MKIICKKDCQVPGFGVVFKGETINWRLESFPEHMIGNFSNIDGSPIVATGDFSECSKDLFGNSDKTEKDKKEIIAKMAKIGPIKLRATADTLGVPYTEKTTDSALAKAILRAQGSEID